LRPTGRRITEFAAQIAAALARSYYLFDSRAQGGGFRSYLIAPSNRSGGTFFHPRNSKWGQIRLKTGPIVASAIEQRPVSALIPYAKNARTHSPAQVTQIVASITEFGFTNPILIDSNGGIIAGHGRVMAAKEMGLATVPCIVLAHLTPARTQSEP
jgi:ParB-like nuclease domain